MSDERLLAFTRALADSVRGGLPPAEALRASAVGTAFRRELAAAAESVSAGLPLHESLGAQGVFPPVLIALLRAGEESGKADEFLDRFSAALEVRIELGRRLKRALVYPALALLLGAALFALFTFAALPLLLQPLLDAGVPQPPALARVEAAKGFVAARWPLLLGAAAAAALLLRTLAGSGPARRLRALAGHRLPGARFVTEEARSQQLCSLMELLLGAGLRPRQIMDILGQYFGDDPVTRRRLALGAQRLAEGRGFTESLGACLPAEDLHQVLVAERAGRLDESFGRLAASHRDRHLHRLKLAAGWFQIGAVMTLAPLCFAMALWMLWPTLSMPGEAGSLLSKGLPVDGLGAGCPAPQAERGNWTEPPPVPVETPEAARFNESNARRVADFMREHSPAAEPEDRQAAQPPAAESGPSESEPQPRPKNYGAPAPKLKPRRPMQRPRFKKIEPTTIRSSLE